MYSLAHQSHQQRILTAPIGDRAQLQTARVTEDIGVQVAMQRRDVLGHGTLLDVRGRCGRIAVLEDLPDILQESDSERCGGGVT